MRIIAILLSVLFLNACEGGCDWVKLKDKAMEYKDKIPGDKIPTKLPN